MAEQEKRPSDGQIDRYYPPFPSSGWVVIELSFYKRGGRPAEICIRGLIQILEAEASVTFDIHLDHNMRLLEDAQSTVRYRSSFGSSIYRLDGG